MVGVIEYGAGNLRSVCNALESLGAAWTLVAEPESLDVCSRVILPGVGHFGFAMERLAKTRMAGALAEWTSAGRPLLGICLGAQLLMESSEEAPGVAGLSLITGHVIRLRTKTIPHMGWNRVTASDSAALLDPARSDFFYFAHSFVCAPEDESDIAATAECGGEAFCVAVQCGNVFGVQFHPEKSAAAGLALLKEFTRC